MEMLVEVNGLPEVVGGVVDEDCPKRRCWLPSKARGSRRVCSTRADSGCPGPKPGRPAYSCRGCGHRFEFNIDGCPECGSQDVDHDNNNK